MSEQREGEFSSLVQADAEQARERAIVEKYDQLPEGQRRLFASAGIEHGIRGVLGHTMDARPQPDGKLGEDDIHRFDAALGGLYARVDTAAVDADQKAKVRAELNTFVSQTEVPGVGTLDHALGYTDEQKVPQAVDTTSDSDRGDLDTIARLAAADNMKAALIKAGISEEDSARFDPMMHEVMNLVGQTELTDDAAAAIRSRWRGQGLRRSQVEEILDAAPTAAKVDEQILDGYTQKTDQEIKDEKLLQGEAGGFIEKALELRDDAEAAIAEMPEGKEKEDWRARLARWNLRLKEKGYTKIGGFVWKSGVIAALAAMIFMVGYLHLIGKGAKKK